jgi:hypothetical protein
MVIPFYWYNHLLVFVLLMVYRDIQREEKIQVSDISDNGTSKEYSDI